MRLHEKRLEGNETPEVFSDVEQRITNQSLEKKWKQLNQKRYVRNYYAELNWWLGQYLQQPVDQKSQYKQQEKPGINISRKVDATLSVWKTAQQNKNWPEIPSSSHQVINIFR